jgi:hypothetical protein
MNLPTPENDVYIIKSSRQLDSRRSARGPYCLATLLQAILAKVFRKFFIKPPLMEMRFEMGSSNAENRKKMFEGLK